MEITMGEPLHSAWMSLAQEQINYRTAMVQTTLESGIDVGQELNGVGSGKFEINVEP